MEAIILAGGLGTRLKSVISDIPKPMAPIGNKPFLTYLFNYLKAQGVTKIILAVGYKWEIIKETYGKNYEGMELIYSIEEEPLGTGGAIKKALEKALENEIFIVNGDTYFEVDLQRMMSKFNNKKSDLILAVKPMVDFERYGKVIHENEKIIKFEEKKFQKSGDINGGIYIIRKRFFEDLILEKNFSFETDILEKFLNRKKINIFSSQEYFIDIGIPEDYKAFRLKMEE